MAYITPEDVGKIRQSFAEGYVFGKRKRRSATPREASEAGAVDTDAFCAGSDDGAKGDRFRLDMPTNPALQLAYLRRRNA